MNAIELQNVTKRYKGFTLDHVSFAVPEGTIVGLVGENGAGKTTIIRTIMGACNPSEGSVTLLGAAGGEGSCSKAFAEVKQDVGVVLDEGDLPYFKGKYLERMFAGIYKDWDKEQFYSFAKRFDIPRNTTVQKLSRGTKMKLAIACALSHHAKLLVLDEPTGGLDPLVRDQIIDVLMDFTRDSSHSILISSHIVSDLEKLCDYIAYVHGGTLQFFEEKDRLLEKAAAKGMANLEEYIISVAKENAK